jgi:short-subunit dehydrogenase
MPVNSNIINLSGTFIYGGKGQIPYYTSKRGLEDLTIALSEELKEKNIYVNCISPADTLTEAYKKGFPKDVNDPMNSPENVATQIVKIIGSNKTGQFILIRNGVTSMEGFHK